MLKISDNSIIYIMCPAGSFTGGPEALHQFSYKLKILGFKTKILLIPVGGEPHPYYRIYQPDYVYSLEDDKRNILIAPEIWISLLSDFSDIQKAVWWLSVDYAIDNNQISDNLFNNSDLVHFAQCRYVEDFLVSNNAPNLYRLSDFLNKDHFRIRNQDYRRTNIVLYNPSKGKKITDSIIDAVPDLHWRSIHGLIPSEVAKLMEQAKVYIDFGHHPGKDRLPREAAIHGCCVIIGLRGSANFFEDIPIPKKYKFSVKQLDIGAVISLIYDCLINYSSSRHDFKEYIELIEQGESVFESELKSIFINNLGEQ